MRQKFSESRTPHPSQAKSYVFSFSLCIPYSTPPFQNKSPLEKGAGQAALTELDPDTNSTIPCPQCDRLFYRRDLLQRHLTLKHGKTPRAGRRVADSGISPPLQPVSSPESNGSGVTRQLPHAARNVQDPEEPGRRPHDALVADIPMDGVNDDGSILPISGELFPFPSPSVDLAQDWGWLHQNPLPTLPVESGSTGQGNRNNEMPEFVGAVPACLPGFLQTN